MKEAFGAFESGLTEMCFPSPCVSDISINKTCFFRQHYRITLAASLEKINSRILGGVLTICLII